MLAAGFALGLTEFPARAVPDLVVGSDYTYAWTPADPSDHSYSGTITLGGPYSDSGPGALGVAGAIVSYSIMTPAGLFTPENSFIASPSTRLISWDDSAITSMSLIFVRNDPEHNLLRAKDDAIALAVDPPGHWLAYVPDASSTLALLLGSAAALVAIERLRAGEERCALLRASSCIAANFSATRS